MNNRAWHGTAFLGVLASAVVLAGLGAPAMAQAKRRTPMMNPAQARMHANAHVKANPAHHASAKVTAAQADAIVLKRFPGKVEGKTKLENENGKMQFSVMDRSGKTLREVMVDANTGKIASVEVTTNKKEAAEKKVEIPKGHAMAHKVPVHKAAHKVTGHKVTAHSKVAHKAAAPKSAAKSAAKGHKTAK